MPFQTSEYQPADHRPPTAEELAHPPDVVSIDAVRGLSEHPRILLDARGWTALRERTVNDPLTAKVLARLKDAGDAALLLPPINFTPAAPGKNILRAIRAAEYRITALAMLYRLMDDARYRDGALGVMRSLVDVDWPRDHFMDTAIAIYALAVGYDWLFDQLSPAERTHIARRIAEGGLEPSLVNESTIGWLYADHNWNQVCHGGMVTAAVATSDHQPVLAHRIINRAIAMLPRAARCYAPDGVYPEGPSYWAYGTQFHVLQAEIFRTAFGSDFGLTRFPGLLSSANVLDRLTAPSGCFFNYYDNHLVRTHAPVVLWFARETRAAGMSAREIERIFAPHHEPDPMLLGELGLALSLLWMDTSLPAAAAPVTNQPGSAWLGDGFNPIVVLRAASTDAEPAWLAAKAGSCNKSHGHMDVGSFVFEANGVRWAIDPYHEEYASVMQRGGLTHGQLFDYTQHSNRWNVLRLGPDGHNILRFDQHQQSVEGHAWHVSADGSDNNATATLDLSPVYAGQVKRVTRRFDLDASGELRVTDAWTTGDTPRRVTWQWVTLADVTVHATGATLTQDGKSLDLGVTEGGPFTVRVDDLSKGLDARFDSTYAGLKRIVIEVDTAPHTRAQLIISAKHSAAK